MPKHFCRHRPDAGTVAKDVNSGGCTNHRSRGTFDAEMGSPDGHRKAVLYGIVEKGVTTTSALPRPHAGPSTANLHGGGSEVDGEDARRKRARKEPESLGFNAPPEPLTPLTNVDTNQYLVDILLHGRH